MALNPVGECPHVSCPQQTHELRTCWICLGTDEDNATMSWVKPCSCRGSGEWVHQSCLLLWIEEKRKEDGTAKIRCPQCKVEYIIFFPKSNVLLSFIQGVDDFVFRASPMVAAGVTVGIIYWAASSYGAFTILQIFGEEDGMRMLECVDPLALVMFLPSIPTALIIMKLLQWEDLFLAFLRRGSKYPVLRHVLPSIVYKEVMGEQVEMKPRPEPLCSTRIFVSALIFPTVAKICGDVFFESEESALKRFLMYRYKEVMGEQVEMKPRPEPLCSTRIFVSALIFPTVAKICGDVFFESEKSALKRFLMYRYKEVMGEQVEMKPRPEPLCSTRIFVSALIFPTVAKICGDVFFESEESALKRFLMYRYKEVMGEQVEMKPRPEPLCSTRIFVSALIFPTVAKICGDVFFESEKSALKRFLMYRYKEVMGEQVEMKPRPEPLCSTRIFVSALIFPTVAKICGDVFFESEESALKRFLMGGLAYTVIKGVLKMYYKQRSYVHYNQRRVLNRGERREPKEIIYEHI